MKTFISFCLLYLGCLSLSAQGNSLHFDGVDDHVSFAGPQSPNFNRMMDFTIEVWVKAPADQVDLGGATNVIIFKGQASTRVPYSIRIGNGTDVDVDNGIVAFRRLNNMNLLQMYSTTPINDDQWHHIAVTKSGMTINLYIDGILEDTDSDLPSGGLNDSSPMYIGCRDGILAMPLMDFFTGELDDLRMWSVARTESEINSTLNQELTGSETDLLRYFDFNQGTPGGDNSAETSLTNVLGPPASDGSLNNFALMGSTSNFLGSNYIVFPGGVPTLSQWGLIILSLLLLIFGISSVRASARKPIEA